ncbi:hypothetical protein F5883DRAFT_607597 [Diaporthe sp. PMI_573]|nr:hypothetical protein F5883DRAFT_607597 [Diaporthaceae sp. PMI_573]
MNEPHTRSHEEQTPQIIQKRKRQIDRDSDHEPVVKRIRLTRENLALFDKMGKKKKVTDSTDESGSTKNTSTTISGFAIKAYKNGMVLPLSSKPPTNLKARRKQGAKSRGTASPTKSEQGHYVDRVGNAGNKATIIFEVGRKLLKEYNNKGYTRAFNRAFTGFPKDVGFNNSLGAVLYKNNVRSTTLAHLTGKWKRCGKDIERATLQGGFDRAALVYTRNQALSYLGKSNPPGHAEITTFTTDGTSLNFYAHHVTQTEDKNSQIPPIS